MDKQLGSAFQLQSSTGTVWAGGAQGLSQNIPVQVNWNWHVWELLLLKFTSDIHLKSDILEAKTKVRLGTSYIELDGLSGLLKANAVSELLEGQGLSFSAENDVYLQNISLVRNDAMFVSASGKADWSGGVVRAKELPDGKLELPPMLAGLSGEEQGVYLSVTEQQDSGAIVDIHISHEGIAHLKLRERVGKYVDIPSQLKRGNPDNIMFEIKRQVFDTKGRF